MPVIRVTCPENVLTAQQKEQFAPLLIDAVMTQEVNPVTDVARHATFLSCTTRSPAELLHR
jgi:hypothetical protein